MELNVYLRGGGTRLASYLGALRQIEEQGGRVRGWAGVSAGSLVAAFFAAGHTHQDAVDLLMDTDFRQFRDFRPTATFRRYGLYAGEKLEQWLTQITEGRRFQDLEVPLAIIAYDIESNQPVVFSDRNTPDALLATAIRCSATVPGLFALHRVNDQPLIDGGLAQVDEQVLFPWGRHPCVTIRLVRKRPRRSDEQKFGFGTYVRRLAELLFDAVDNVRVPSDRWRQTLIIQTGAYAAFDFNLTGEDKQALYQMGYEQCREYLDLNALAAETTDGT